MENLTRYSIEELNNPVDYCIVESPIGEWVKFSDIKELLQTSHNKQITPCSCNADIEYIPQSVRVCKQCGCPKQQYGGVPKLVYGGHNLAKCWFKSDLRHFTLRKQNGT